jgi:Transient receptor potential (TRP) ion channel
VGGAVVRVLLFGRRSSLWLLAEDLPAHEPLYGQYRVQRYCFFVFPLIAMFIRALLIAAAKNNGTVQIVIVVCIELCLLLSHVVWKPGKTRRADILSVFLSVVRLVTAGLLMAFIVPVAIPPIPRVVIGIIVLVLFSIAVIVMFFNTLWNLGLRRLWSDQRFAVLRSRGSSSQGSLEGMTEKDVEKGNSNSNLTSRPLNPTPTHSGPPVDPAMNAPDALSQVTPTTIDANEPSSAHSSNSTMSYGVPVVSRWRASPLEPPSRTGSHTSPGGVPSPSSPLSHVSNRYSTVDGARAL